MSNYFDEVIERFKKANGGKEDEVITALRAKRQEMGEDATKDEILGAIGKCLEEQLSGIVKELDSRSIEELTDKEKECKQNANDVISKYLEENKIEFRACDMGNVTFYELEHEYRGVTVEIRIYVEVDPAVCRIEAILPVNADLVYEYPLCLHLMNTNLKKRFGVFKYDEDDGEITFEYSFLIGNGVAKEDFGTYLKCIISTAAFYCGDIKKYCIGRFNNKEATEILKKVKELVDDIQD